MLSFMLKTYQGDIYNNMIALVISGIVASYLSFYLIGKFESSMALTLGFMILSISSGFLFPSIGGIVASLPNIATVDNTAMGVLSLAKLGAGSAHHLAYLFVVWEFSAHQVSFVFASSNLISRLVACLAP